MKEMEEYVKGEPQFRGDYDWDRIRRDILAEQVKLGISGSEMARRLKWTQGMYSMFEHQQRKRLGRETLLKVCLYFNVPHTHYLIGSSTEKAKPALIRPKPGEIECWETVKQLLFIIEKKHVGSKAEMLQVAQQLIRQIYEAAGGGSEGM